MFFKSPNWTTVEKFSGVLFFSFPGLGFLLLWKHEIIHYVMKSHYIFAYILGLSPYLQCLSWLNTAREALDLCPYELW